MLAFCFAILYNLINDTMTTHYQLKAVLYALLFLASIYGTLALLHAIFDRAGETPLSELNGAGKSQYSPSDL